MQVLQHHAATCVVVQAVVPCLLTMLAIQHATACIKGWSLLCK